MMLLTTHSKQVLHLISSQKNSLRAISSRAHLIGTLDGPNLGDMTRGESTSKEMGQINFFFERDGAKFYW